MGLLCRLEMSFDFIFQTFLTVLKYTRHVALNLPLGDSSGELTSQTDKLSPNLKVDKLREVFYVRIVGIGPSGIAMK